MFPLLTFFSFIMPMIAIATMVSQRSHILMSLLALESMILSLTLILMLTSNPFNPMDMFLALIILTFGACEASLGLACLVFMSRMFGNDLFSSSTLSKC